MQFFDDLAAPDQASAARVRSEQVRVVYRAQPLALFTVLVTSAVLLMSLWGLIPRFRLLVWLSAILGMTVFRLVSYQLFVWRQPSDDQAIAWAWPMVVGSALSGMVWGGVPIWLWPPDAPLHQALVVTLLAGMTVGSVSTMSPLLGSAQVFIHAALWPLVGRFTTLPPELALSFVAFGLMFVLMLSITATRIHRVVVTSLTARFQHQRAEAKIQQQAHYDALTDLPNRRFLLERLAQELARARRHGHTGAVLFLDLDNFKNINDSLGHTVGDAMLQRVAERLRARTRAEDVAARLGGDEFVVLLPQLDADRGSALIEAEKIAGEIGKLLSETYLVAGHELHATASIGIALFPGDGLTPHDILKHADTAMYRAKAGGRNAARVFLPSMQVAALRRLTVEKELRRGLSEGQLRVHYQPQVNLERQVIGLEGLARWEHPERGLVLPGEFIGVAEETGLIFDVHDWLLDQVCRDIRQLGQKCQGVPCPVVSMNVSPREFRRPGFEQRLASALTASGVRAGNLRLEITESLAMEKVDRVVAKMHTLRELGVTFAVDDFGTGYSSLAYLKQLPVDFLKIDRSFVRDVPEDPNDAKIVEAIIAMSRHLGIKPVAEGVERQETLDFLRNMGCAHFQGWLFGRAAPLSSFLETWPRSPASVWPGVRHARGQGS